MLLWSCSSADGLVEWPFTTRSRLFPAASTSRNFGVSRLLHPHDSPVRLFDFCLFPMSAFTLSPLPPPISCVIERDVSGASGGCGSSQGPRTDFILLGSLKPRKVFLRERSFSRILSACVRRDGSRARLDQDWISLPRFFLSEVPSLLERSATLAGAVLMRALLMD